MLHISWKNFSCDVFISSSDYKINSWWFADIIHDIIWKNFLYDIFISFSLIYKIISKFNQILQRYNSTYRYNFFLQVRFKEIFHRVSLTIAQSILCLWRVTLFPRQPVARLRIEINGHSARISYTMFPNRAFRARRNLSLERRRWFKKLISRISFTIDIIF